MFISISKIIGLLNISVFIKNNNNNKIARFNSNGDEKPAKKIKKLKKLKKLTKLGKNLLKLRINLNLTLMKLNQVF